MLGVGGMGGCVNDFSRCEWSDLLVLSCHCFWSFCVGLLHDFLSIFYCMLIDRRVCVCIRERECTCLCASVCYV